MDRSLFIMSLTPLLPRRHSFGPPHLPGSGSFAISRHSPWIMLHPKVWHFLLPHAFPWIPVLSAYIPILLHPRGEFGGSFFFLAAEVLGGILTIPLSLFLPVDSIQQGAMGRSLRACYRYTNLSVGDLAVYGSGCVSGKLWLARCVCLASLGRLCSYFI